MPASQTAPAAPWPRLALLAITRQGVMQAARLARHWPQATVCAPAQWAAPLAALPNPQRIYSGALRHEIGPLWAGHDQLVCFVSLGAMVRLLAPHLKSKHEDPGVTVVDEAARFAIAMLSGHVGGANECAQRVAALLGAVPVITTASDVTGTLAVDILGRDHGWRVVASPPALTQAAASVVNGEPVAFVQEAGRLCHWWPHAAPLPGNIRVFSRMADVPPNAFAAVLWATADEAALQSGWPGQTKAPLVIYLTPPDAA